MLVDQADHREQERISCNITQAWTTVEGIGQLASPFGSRKPLFMQRKITALEQRSTVPAVDEVVRGCWSKWLQGDHTEGWWEHARFTVGVDPAGHYHATLREAALKKSRSVGYPDPALIISDFIKTIEEHDYRPLFQLLLQMVRQRAQAIIGEDMVEMREEWASIVGRGLEIVGQATQLYQNR